MKTNVSIKFSSIEEYREIEKKLIELGYYLPNVNKDFSDFIISNYSKYSLKFKTFVYIHEDLDFTIAPSKGSDKIYNSFEEFLKDQVMKVNKFNTWRKRLYRCSIYRNNWNNLSIKNKKLNKISINNHEYHYDI